MKKIAFLPKAFDDFQKWSSDNQKIYNKIVQLIKEISRDPKLEQGNLKLSNMN
jgi:toxin YoeB